MKEYKYDAFISYRHSELDKYVAENLHKILENYELPKNIKNQLNIEGKSIKRVFRDQEELPLASNLEDPIIDALNNSKYLIVICSLRLKDSLWCKKEIETFIKIRGKKNIFCVLIDGEPRDSFPEEVLYEEKEITKNGKTKKEKVLVEPLAADVRGANKKEVLKKLKKEKLRLVAGMFNLNYDDLKQRHKQRKQKRILFTTVSIAVFCLLFALYTGVMLLKINNQQRILKKHQALSLAKDSENYLNIDDRYDAIKSSYQALTKFNGVKMPYTPEAEYALSESLGIYDSGTSYKAINEIETKGISYYIKTSSNNKYAAVYDGSEQITLFKTKTLDIIKIFNVNGNLTNENSISFIGNDILSYVNEKGNISLVNVKDGKQIKEIKKEKYSYSSIKGDSKGDYLVYTDTDKLYIYSIKNNKTIGNIEKDEKFLKSIYYSENNDYVFVATSENDLDLNKEDHLTIHVIETKTANEINEVTLDAGYISGIITKNDNAYLLLNNSIGTDYNMLVVSYDFISGETNWSKSFENHWGKFITKSYPDGTNDLAIVNYDTINILDMDNGDVVESFNTSSEIINIYSYLNNEIYLVFSNDGSVNFINMKYKNNVEYIGKFKLNIEKYSFVTKAENGFLLIPRNENRVILYDAKSNKKYKKVNIEKEELKDNSVSSSKYESLVKEYKIKNKDLINRIFYDTDKKILFVNYTNNDIAIYDTKEKKLLKLLNNVGTIKYYFGKDKYNRIYIGDISDSYILDESFNKVGHIACLFKLKNDKVIIHNNDEYYEIKIYTLEDILKEAKEYLK